MSEAEEGGPIIEMVLPDGWYEVGLSVDEVDAQMAQFRSREVEAAFPDAAGREDYLGFLRSTELQARAAFARARQEKALAFLQYMARSSEEPYLLSASLLVFLRRFRDPIREMADQLDARAKLVDPVDLGDGRFCIRVGELMHTMIDGLDLQLTVYGWRYYLELEGTDLIAALVFVTPNVPLAEDFAAVFDQMVATFRVIIPSDVGEVVPVSDAETL